MVWSDNHIKPHSLFSLNQKMTFMCFPALPRAFCRNRVSYSFEFPSFATRQQVRDVEVQGCSSQHPTHCIKHSQPSACCHTLRCPHTARGLQVKQVADRYYIFLEAVMRREVIYRGRREKKGARLGFFIIRT